jgi:VacB/RNase II family 3'-5' exoribonuclease
VFASDDVRRLLADGFAAIREQYGVTGPFPEEVLAEAEAAARAEHTARRPDQRGLPLVTLDPAASLDLDQAFALHAEGDDIVLSYAIADVGAFVARGGAIDAEAWRRGVTVYAPDGRVPLHPTVLSEGAASLLPDGDRPAVVLTVAVDADGGAVLRSARRAVVRSRAKLAYETVRDGELPELLRTLSQRAGAAEEARGAGRIDFPAPEIVVDPSVPGGLTVRAKPRAPSEDLNAHVSLSANLAVARRMIDAGIGVFRVMAEAPEERLDGLRRAAKALGVAWPKGTDLRQVTAGLDPDDPHHAAFLRAVRQAGGGATYATLETGPPWHAVIAAPYAHATAPLRRLADRYVLDLLCELETEAHPDAGTAEAIERLPQVMEEAETRAARVDRAAIDLVETVVLRDRVGEEFPATVIDADGDRARIQLVDPPVRAAVDIGRAEPGQAIGVRLRAVDVGERRLEFEAVR